MCRLTTLIGLLILFPLVTFSESHAPNNQILSNQHRRPEALPKIEEKPPLFEDEPGDLNDSERKEVEGLSLQIREQAKTGPRRGDNLGEYLRWEHRAHDVLQLQKKLSAKFQSENLKSDAEIAKKELDELLQICIERKGKGLNQWLRLW